LRQVNRLGEILDLTRPNVQKARLSWNPGSNPFKTRVRDEVFLKAGSNTGVISSLSHIFINKFGSLGEEKGREVLFED